jgi:hypothetical protein
MNFDNISILTENIVDIIRAIRYCWVDDSGLICEQQGVFRVNCLDCLDRTNIVQSSIGRIVLEVQVQFFIFCFQCATAKLSMSQYVDTCCVWIILNGIIGSYVTVS